jgi:hypothetical protein
MLQDGKTDKNCSQPSSSLLVLYETEDGKQCRSAKKVSRMFPQCLILDAKTLKDKMRVVSWWVSLEGKEMKAAFESLKTFYRAPSNSSSPLHRQGSGVNTGAMVYAGACDSLEHREASLRISYSTQNERPTKRRKRSDPATTTTQLRDGHVRQLELNVIHSVSALLKGTTKAEDGAFVGNHDTVFQYRTNVATPGKHGTLTGPKKLRKKALNVLVACNEGSAKQCLGDDFLDEMCNRPDEETVVYYSDNYDGNVAQPFEEKKEQRKRSGSTSDDEMLREADELMTDSMAEDAGNLSLTLG